MSSPLYTAVESTSAARWQPQARPGLLPLRLLLLTDTAITDTGGSECFLRNLVEGLDGHRYLIDVVQLSAAPSSERARPSVRLGFGTRLQHLPVGAAYGPRGWRTWRELRRRILRGDYDIIQSQHEKSDLLSALLPRGPTRICKISNRRDSGFQKGPLLRTLFRRLNGRFDLIVAPSSTLLKELAQQESVQAGQTRHLPNGVDSARFQPATSTQRERQRPDLCSQPGAFLFGCVARLAQVKRQQDLIDAFAMIAEQAPQAELVLIGDGPMRSELQARVRRSGLESRIRFLGARRDIEQILPLLDAFVLCSLTEGMSNAVLEAMACGLPVIATAVGGNPEMVDPGQTGLLVPACAPEQLAEAMLQLLADPVRSREWGVLGRQRILQRYTLAAMVERFDQLYGDLCNRSQPA